MVLLVVSDYRVLQSLSHINISIAVQQASSMLNYVVRDVIGAYPTSLRQPMSLALVSSFYDYLSSAPDYDCS